MRAPSRTRLTVQFFCGQDSSNIRSLLKYLAEKIRDLSGSDAADDFVTREVFFHCATARDLVSVRDVSFSVMKDDTGRSSSYVVTYPDRSSDMDDYGHIFYSERAFERFKDAADFFAREYDRAFHPGATDDSDGSK